MIYRWNTVAQDCDDYIAVKVELSKQNTSELRDMYPELERKNCLDKGIIFGGYATGLTALFAGAFVRDVYDVSWSKYLIEGGMCTWLTAHTYCFARLVFGDIQETIQKKSAIEKILSEREKGDYTGYELS